MTARRGARGLHPAALAAIVALGVAGCGEAEPTVRVEEVAPRLATSRSDDAANAPTNWSAPSFATTSLGGGAVSLSALRGRPVLLNVWATWCTPCREEIPELAALHARYAAEGLAVIGVSIDDGSALEEVRAFAAELEIPFEIWLDPDARVSAAFEVRALPATFLLDREGQVLFRRDRPITADDPELTRALRGALGWASPRRTHHAGTP